jgi:phosphoglycolate phosphatase-like HAD superfamily hydrolase
MTQPPATLDHVLARTRHLLLDFDGPICDFYPGQSARTVANQLRKRLRDQDVAVPDDIAPGSEPLEVLAYCTTVSPGLAASIEAELTTLEVTAAPSTVPSAHAADLLIACRESGRTISVVSPISTQAIHAYLEHHDLASVVNHVIGRTGPRP